MIQQPKKDGKCDVYTFDSIGQYGEHVKAVDDSGKYWPESKRSSGQDRGSQWASDTLQESIERACAGGYWAEGAAELQQVDLAGTAGEMISQIEVEIELGVQGGCVDAGEYLANSPECFLQLQEIERAKPVVKIGVLCTASHDTTGEQVMNRGRAVLGLVDALEERGFSVQLDAVNSCQGYDSQRYCEFRVILKQAGQQWAAGSVAYPLANSSWARKLGFRAAEGSDAGASTKAGYGKYEKLSGWKDKATADYDLTFGYMVGESCYNRPTSAMAEIIKQANKQAPELLAGAAS